MRSAFVVTLVLASVVLTFGVTFPAAADCSTDPNRATRDWLQAMLTAREEGSIPPWSSSQWQKIRQTAKSLRVSSAPVALPIARAPYFPAVLLSQYSRIYADELARKIKEYTSPIPLDALFNEVLAQIRDYQAMSPAAQAAYRAQGGQNAEVASSADEMGFCLANNAAKDLNCALDLSDHEDVPSSARQAYVALTCTEGGWLDSWTPCDYRNFVFNVAKPKLKELRSRPSVIEQVSQKVRDRFANEFPGRLLGADGLKKQDEFNALVAAKFGAQGAGSALWSPRASLTADGEVCLQDFAQSLELDIMLARASLAMGDVPSLADGSAYFYSAVNRFFLVNGGAEISINPGSTFVLGQEPILHSRFGGFGVDLQGYSPWTFDIAESGAYDPAGALAQAKALAHQQKYGGSLNVEAPTPFRIFPERFHAAARGEIRPGFAPAPADQVENLSDLARLIRASVSLLRSSRSAPDASGVLSRFFGTEAELVTGMMSASSPVIFPINKGRGAAMGVLSGALQNLTVPGKGHVQVLDLMDPHSDEGLGGPSMGLYAHDRVRLDARERAPMKTESVIALLSAASELVNDLSSVGGSHDPVYPEAFRNSSSQLELATGLLAINLIGLAQTKDGSFREELSLDPKVSTRISSTLRALDALARMPHPEAVVPWEDGIVAGWGFIQANRAQIDVMTTVDPSLPLIAVTAWDRAAKKVPLAHLMPATAQWIELKRTEAAAL